jgi:hypothetical protein
MVKDIIYREALDETGTGSWVDKVPASVVDLIKKNWDIVKGFARSDDNTRRVMGMKFPLEGYK